MTMTKSDLIVSSEIHDFIAHVSTLKLDFSGYNWEENFESVQEWIDYQEDLIKKYSTFSVHFTDFDLPESDDEDETVEDFYESTHCDEDGFYYRVLVRWIDEEIGWCVNDLEYSIEKV